MKRSRVYARKKIVRSDDVNLQLSPVSLPLLSSPRIAPQISEDTIIIIPSLRVTSTIVNGQSIEQQRVANFHTHKEYDIKFYSAQLMQNVISNISSCISQTIQLSNARIKNSSPHNHQMRDAVKIDDCWLLALMSDVNVNLFSNQSLLLKYILKSHSPLEMEDLWCDELSGGEVEYINNLLSKSSHFHHPPQHSHEKDNVYKIRDVIACSIMSILYELLEDVRFFRFSSIKPDYTFLANIFTIFHSGGFAASSASVTSDSSSFLSIMRMWSLSITNCKLSLPINDNLLNSLFSEDIEFPQRMGCLIARNFFYTQNKLSSSSCGGSNNGGGDERNSLANNIGDLRADTTSMSSDNIIVPRRNDYESIPEDTDDNVKKKLKMLMIDSNPYKLLPKYKASVICHLCKSSQFVTIRMKRTRSADEPATTVNKCRNPVHRKVITWSES